MSSGPDFSHNAFAEQRRTEKAIALETALAGQGVNSDAAATLPPAARRRFEKAAGVRACSAETWARAIGFLADYERTLAERGTEQA